MADPQLLSLPAAETGLAPVSGSSAWAFGSLVTASTSLSTGIWIVALAFQNTDIPATDTLQEILFEVVINGVTKLQIPFSMKADTLVGYNMDTNTSGSNVFYLPEPYFVPANSSVLIKVTDSIAAALTYNGVKLFYKTNPNAPTVALNTPADAGSTSDTTPVLDFTGTDAESDDVRFQLQLDTVDTFDGQAGDQTTDTVTATGSWTAPAGVTSVSVECWGAGGSSGGTDNINGSGGGGGGAYSKLNTFSVTPGNSYTVTVGQPASAAADETNGSAGGDSWFNSTGTVLAKGGSGGNTGDTNGLGGAGGAAASGVGDTKYSGGAGGDGSADAGGGGGGGAGTGGNGGDGGDASGSTGGTAGSAGSGSGGGAGGTGGNLSANGTNGSVAGGGGGGPGEDGTAGRVGGRGEVRITYTPSLPLLDKVSGNAQTTDTITATGSWVAPAGVTSIMVEAWGAGGGGDTSATDTGGGGGGGGAYSKTNAITVVPTTSYTVTVGTGGGAGSAGGDSGFDDNSQILAKGGSGATNLNGASGGASGSCVGDLKFSGGTGGTGYNGAGGGGSGGGGAGTGEVGSNGANGAFATNGPAGGAGGSLNGGNGGAGGTYSGGNGANGSVRGGGGGGGTYTTGTGGTGGRGEVRITYSAAGDTGFANPDTGGDTDPFNSGENIQYTVQVADTLSFGTYYWRVRAIDPNGSNGYGAWSSTRSFTVAAANIPNKIYILRQAVNRSNTY